MKNRFQNLPFKFQLAALQRGPAPAAQAGEQEALQPAAAGRRRADGAEPRRVPQGDGRVDAQRAVRRIPGVMKKSMKKGVAFSLRFLFFLPRASSSSSLQRA
jgi:hypothetical protein